MIRFHTLGRVELTGPDGRSLTSVLSQPRRVALLAYLALAQPGSFHRRDRLLGVFWPEMDTEHGRGALNQAVYMLRRALGSSAILSRGTEELALNLADVWCDAVAFDAALKAGNTSEALSLYRGPLLDGFFVSDAAGFEEWLELERARLLARVTEATWQQAETERRRGNIPEAAELARRAADLQPGDEHALRRLVQFLAESGNRAAAFRAYDEFSERLRAVYGIEPSAETVSVITNLRAAEAEPPPHVDATATASGAISVASPPSRRKLPRALQLAGGIALGIALLAVAAIASRWFTGDAASADLSARGDPTTQSIAVLPFINLSGDPENQYFSDGITEEILNQLAQSSALQVVGRSSSFQFRGQDLDLREVGRKLGVAHVLEGSVQKSGNRVRITAQLVDARTGYHVWGQKFDREVERKDVFALEDEISRAIADALSVRLGSTPSMAVANVDVHELYLRGQFQFNKLTEEGLTRALDYFQQALARDPNYAPAHLGVAHVYLFLADAFMDPKVAYPKVKEAAARVLAGNPRSAEALTMLAIVESVYEWNWTKAEETYRRALADNPNSPTVNFFYANQYTMRGDLRGAIAQMRKAVRLDPLNPVYNGILALWQVWGRDFDGALAQDRRTDEIDPNFWFITMAAGDAYREKKMYPEAIREYEHEQKVLGGFPSAGLGVTYARMGRKNDARKIARALEDIARTRWVSPDRIAAIYANLGEHDRAFAILEQGIRDKATWIAWAPAMPEFDPIRADARYARLLAQLNLTGFHDASNTSTASDRTPAVGVLPFVNVNADASTDYFTDGLTEEVINALAKVPGLRVPARTSSFAFKGVQADVRDIGRQLDVGYVVEGSVRTTGKRIRVSAHLIDVSNGYHVWSDSYDRDVKNIFEIQQDISQAIMQRLLPELTNTNLPAVPPTNDIEAYRLYLRGRYLLPRRTVNEAHQALAFFQDAIRRDPGFAQAHAGLGDAYALLPYFRAAPSQDALANAEAAAQRAIQLDSTIAEPHSTLGWINFTYRWNWKAAEEHFETALRLNPVYTTAVHFYSLYLARVAGRHTEAVALAERAQRLDPLSPMMHTGAGAVYYHARLFDRAIQAHQHALAMDSTYYIARYFLGKAYLASGRWDEAIATLSRDLSSASTGDRRGAIVAYAYFKTGRRAEGLKIMQQAEGASPVMFAILHTALGDFDSAFAALERAAAERETRIVEIQNEPLLDPLRRDPRFKRIVSRVGLP